MAPNLLPEALQGFASELGTCVDSLREILASSAVIPAGSFQQLAGTFTRLLNLILKSYPDLTDAEKDTARPFILYWRQLQGYLVFLLRFPDILQVPHHSEINQALDFITQQEKLLEDVYIPLARQEKNLFSGQFRGHLEECLGKRASPQAKKSE